MQPEQAKPDVAPVNPDPNLPPGESPPPPEVPPGVPPMIVKSEAAFYRDLPELLKTHYWKWVAYHGDKRLGFAKTQTELYQRYFKQGLKEDEFVVMHIERQALYDNDGHDVLPRYLPFPGE
jgi:hypothetical protein